MQTNIAFARTRLLYDLIVLVLLFLVLVLELEKAEWSNDELVAHRVFRVRGRVRVREYVTGCRQSCFKPAGRFTRLRLRPTSSKAGSRAIGKSDRHLVLKRLSSWPMRISMLLEVCIGLGSPIYRRQDRLLGERSLDENLRM
jgi:hypothetical protein